MATSTVLAERNGTIFSNTGNFIDFEDRLLLDAIPKADYSHGGIYFFGSSNLKWAFTTWDLPPAERRFIANYGVGAASHTIQLELIRYLINYRGFLSAGNRDLVIFGVSFHLAHIDDPSSGFFISLLRRHGLFTGTADNHMAPVPMSAFDRWLRIEKARSAGLFWNIGRLTKNWLIAVFRLSQYPKPGFSDTPDELRGFMGSQWQQNMEAELERLRETILLVKSHHAQVKVMLLPQGTWMNHLPYKPRYEKLIRALCQSTSTPLIDFSHTIPDSDFVDSSHFTVEGQEKFRGLILSEIQGHLESLEKAAETSQADQR